MHPRSLENLRRNGRPTSFTEGQALDVLQARCSYWAGPMTSERLIQLLVEESVISRAVHPKTLQRLLSGKLFPSLLDPQTGKTFDYTKVPKFLPGRPHTMAQAIDPSTGKPKKPISRRQDQIMRSVLEAMKTDIAFGTGQIDRNIRERFGTRFRAIEEQLETIAELKREMALLKQALSAAA